MEYFILTMTALSFIFMTLVFVLIPDDILSSANNSERRASKEGRQ